jgi:hypothetical protein
VTVSKTVFPQPVLGKVYNVALTPIPSEDCGVTKKTMADAFSFLQEYWIELRK